MAKFCTQTRDDHVQDIVLGFMSRSRRYEIMTIFQKCVQVSLHFCSHDIRSVGVTAGSRPITAGWLAGCSSALPSYGDVIHSYSFIIGCQNATKHELGDAINSRPFNDSTILR